MARRKRTSRRYNFAKKSSRRVKHSMLGGGLVGTMVSGAIVGAGIALAAPTINSYVPKIGPLSPVTVATLGAGIVGKSVIHKGGNFTTAAVTLGAAMAASDLMSGMGGASGSASGMRYY